MNTGLTLRQQNFSCSPYQFSKFCRGAHTS
uniref:Uncharacterized protein n=1 Tax=Rhizophora mucronata TaxID=61149 RepID=A0A2P2NTG7_RHIMU